MSEKDSVRRVFLVVRSDWSYNDEFYTGDDAPVKAFTRREQAEAYIRAWEQHWASPAGRHQLCCGQTEMSYEIIETEVAG